MKLFYTDITNNLTSLLAKEAQTYAQDGYRVFYIAPNSLSFEKERQVLSSLPQAASFDITVTRFGQLARYLTLQDKHQPSLDDTGLTMVFYKVLSELDDQELKRYSLLKTDRSFIAQLLDFYKEWQSSNLTWEELAGLNNDKLADIQLIFEGVEKVLNTLELATSSKISQLRSDLAAQKLHGLHKTVIIVDGFTRFTAEEEELLADLNATCHEVVIAAYASPASYTSSYTAGNLYQASIDFLKHLASRFKTQPVPLTGSATPTAFSRMTQLIDNRYAYRQSDLTLTDEDKQQLAIWSVPTIKEELEQVAKAIRKKLQDGHRYKDMLVLLGDVAAYDLQLKRVFDQYAIPFYLGEAEPMAEHPLVQVVDSLERLGRYNFRSEDLVNLVTSGLYGQFDDLELDHFDHYLSYANPKGKQAFSREFKKTNGRFQLDQINVTRQAIMAPLLTFFKTTSAKTSDWLKRLMALFDSISLHQQLQDLANQGSQWEAEKHEQVWKTFCQISEQLYLIFGDSKLTAADFLALLQAGLISATYRVVPATVDVVNVKAYNLIEPHTKPFVFAIGLTQTNFPEIVKNVSLLSDEDRELINANLTNQQLDLPSQDNLKRNHYAFASLLNAATQKLVLSSPNLMTEGEETRSSYLTQLIDLGIEVSHKNSSSLTTDPNDLGTYQSLLARLALAHQSQLLAELETAKQHQATQEANNNQDQDKETATYWGVLIRLLRRKMAEQGLSLPLVSDKISSQTVSKDVMNHRYPADQPLQLSASSLSQFYNNEYLFFLTHILRLQEDDSSLPDARHHGLFIHRVFELMTTDRSELPFEDKLKSALTKAKNDPDLAAIYDQSAQTRYSLAVLTDLITASAQLLSQNDDREVMAEEVPFSDQLASIGQRQLVVTGKIDRLDRLMGSDVYGVVDYKSSDRTFNLADAYNKLTPQLLTYLNHLNSQYAEVFGAMYLHVQQPQLALKKLSSLEAALKELDKTLVYKGLFVKDKATGLASTSRSNQFSQEELDLLLAYNQQLYQEAARKILSGNFAINPYTKDGKSVLGEQLKAITRFEADLHLKQARQLTTFPRKDNKELVLAAMREALDKAIDNN